MKRMNPKMLAKLKEAVSAVLPIVVIVLLLSFTVAPLSPSIILSFLMGAVLVMVGMMFFTLGAEISMTPMGEKVGAKTAKTTLCAPSWMRPAPEPSVFSLPVTDTAGMRLAEELEEEAEKAE